MSRLPPVSADQVLAQVGLQRVEHGRTVCGLTLEDVWTSAPEAAAAAARQKPSDSVAQSQNLMRGYCRARQALEELQVLAMKYGIPLDPPRQPTRVATAPILSLTDLPPGLSVTSCLKPATSTRSEQMTSQTKTTKGGRCLPLAVKADPINSRDDSACQSFWRWVHSDIRARLQRFFLVIAGRLPLLVHFVWIAVGVSSLYMLSRPRLLVRCSTTIAGYLWNFATASGFELIQELDEFFMVHTNPMVSAVKKFGRWGQSRPTLLNATALMEAAAASTSSQHTGWHPDTLAEIKASAKASAAYAILEMERVAFERIEGMQHTGSENEVSSDGTGLVACAMIILGITTAGRRLGLG